MGGWIRPVAAAGGIWFAAVSLTQVAAGDAAARRCTMAPGQALVLVHVERDTTLPTGPASGQALSSSTVRPSPHDSLLAVEGTRMPAARVRLLRADSATRAALAAAGIAGREPVAFLRAAPFRADCRTVRWTDPAPFAVAGDTGFVRATLAPREQWVDATPVLVVTDVSRYPYPRRRGLAAAVSPEERLASPAALFDLSDVLAVPGPPGLSTPDAAAAAQRARGLAWARANPAEREREPVRALVREAVLAADWAAASREVSRLRGTYRVTVETGDARGSWYFRTHDRPGYPWRGRDSIGSTAELLASPYTAGYRLVGYAAATPDALSDVEARWRGATRDGPRVPLVWLAAGDRPTLPGNEARRSLAAVIEFTLTSAPERLWSVLEPLAPPPTAGDSALLARTGYVLPRGERQPRVPITVRLGARGAVRGDTTVQVDGRRVRLILERTDTLSLRRPF